MKVENVGFLMAHKSLLYALGFMVKLAAFSNVIFLSVALATSNGHLYLYEVNKDNERSKVKSSVYH